ncbi:gp077 [Rhodococcus phage ReqiDocB7]|uniref:gp077 n=1 Tax=Rhodococcus phage ReqiDocB7 TaxID=691966 RepID=UPI0001CDD866|nr:gp077 [Rhodococcus phage ReqiDocB7]ADD80863.1 gp077 [Rhodococcus phage ReqiDocB7]
MAQYEVIFYFRDYRRAVVEAHDPDEAHDKAQEQLGVDNTYYDHDVNRLDQP